MGYLADKLAVASPNGRQFRQRLRGAQQTAIIVRAIVDVAPLQNKIGALLTDPTSRRILTEAGRPVDLRRIMDEGKVLLVNLDKGRIGEGPSALLGSLLLSGRVARLSWHRHA